MFCFAGLLLVFVATGTTKKEVHDAWTFFTLISPDIADWGYYFHQAVGSGYTQAVNTEKKAGDELTGFPLSRFHRIRVCR